MISFPQAKFSFGQNVVVHWHEVECGTTQAVITGINLNRHKVVLCTITEENGQVTDEIDEDMITSIEELSDGKSVNNEDLCGDQLRTALAAFELLDNACDSGNPLEIGKAQIEGRSMIARSKNTPIKQVYFRKEMTQDEFHDRLGEAMGGRGKCKKCCEMVNNVAYHEAHDCEIIENEQKRTSCNDSKTLNQDDLVLFDNGDAKGKGRIKGKVNDGWDITYIVEVSESNVDPKIYPYSHIAISEMYLKKP